jgi:hypothetical protein
MSPIFPVRPELVSQGPVENSRYVVFLCPYNGLEFIGRQISAVQERLWFSHGIACAIMFCADRSFEELIKEQADSLSAYEIWAIAADGRVNVERQWLRPITCPQVGLTDYSSLSKDAQRVLQEIEINFYELLRGSAQFMPKQVPRLQRIISAVNQIIKELVFYEDPLNQPVPEHLKEQKEKLKNNRSGLHLRINQALTQLIQLSSSLVYAVSQAFCGSVPILERRPFISPNSLLGTGTAYLALSGLSGFVEDVFEKCPVLKSIDFNYRQGQGFEVFPLVLRYRVEGWRKTGLSLQILPNNSEAVKPKLAYFSARLGFGESHFSVTAAMQVLHGADSVRWSLMTLTHELLHAHVTGLLATIFGESENTGVTDETFAKQFDAFKVSCKAAAEEKPCIPSTPLDSLRFIIFAFVSARACTLEQLSDDSNSGGLADISIGPRETFEEFKKEFRYGLRLLEEIIVHSLDIRYFYAGDLDLFLKLLWESWTTVPAVVGDLDTYLLRSLAAAASLDLDPSIHRRFETAVAKLDANFEALIAESPENQFLRNAKAHLMSKKARLAELFRPILYAADMTAIFLYSKKIESAFWSGDPNIDSGDNNRLSYTFETGDFTHGKVTNPIPFLADRLRRGALDHRELDEDYRSAWLLLAAASAPS